MANFIDGDHVVGFLSPFQGGIPNGILCSSFLCSQSVLWSLFYKDTNSIYEGSTLTTQAPSQGPTSKYHHVGGQNLTYASGGHNHSVHGRKGRLCPFVSLPCLYFRWSFLDDQLLTFLLKIDLCFLMHSKVNNHSKKKSGMFSCSILPLCKLSKI